MGVFTIISIVLVIAVVAFIFARGRSVSLVDGKTEQLHSRPGYYGTYALIWASIPALILLAFWNVVSPIYVENQVRATFPQEVLEGPESAANLTIGMVRNIGEGIRLLDETERTQLSAGFVALRPLLAEKGIALASNGEDYMVASAQALNNLNDMSRMLMAVAVIGLSIAGAIWSILRIRIRLRARNQVEGVILAGLILSSTIAILTTVGIIASMLSETLRFFSYVPPQDFFFGTVWDPRFANANDPDQAGQFGLIPLLAGTMYIAFVAML
ncbi:MAG: phosphate ABC transporter permease family protein, partial [Pseudomonadota bacterium]